MVTNTKSESAPSPRKVQVAVARAIAAVRYVLSSLLSPFGLSLGSIFFIPHPWIGLVLWIALLFNPRYAAFAVLGLAIGAIIKRMLRINEAPSLGGGLKANAMLAAIMTGWMTGALDLSWGLRLGLASASAIVATLLAAAIMRVVSKSILPPLLWGYCLVAAMLYSVCPACTVLSANAMRPWPQPNSAIGWGESLIRSMGSIMYSPEIGTGVFVCLAILLWSRTMFISGLVGWISGVGVALAFQNMHLTYLWLPVSYNFFLTGMALGAAIFLPGRVSLLVAAAGGCSASFFALVLQYAMQWSATSYLPISSAIAIWVGAGALSLAGDRPIVSHNNLPDMPPEQAWWRVANWTQRFGKSNPLFAVPVAGDLQVSQGFDGNLSHRGPFRHALDFQRPQSANKSMSSPSIWGAPVTAPAAGVVERTKNTVQDNVLGICNYANNWGNYVVIRLDQGGWALLSHLQEGTIAVTPGSRVETGTYIGRVGNSGRSPIPHLHLQLQSSPEPGSPTIPFRLANYQSATHPERPLLSWNAAAIPIEGDVVMAAPQNMMLYRALVSITSGSAVWSVETKGHIPRAFRQRRSAKVIRINVVVDDLGRHIFKAGSDAWWKAESEGRLVSSMDPDAWRVIELKRVASPFLKLLGLAAPSIPYAAKTGMIWNDIAPDAMGGLAHALTLSLAPYLRQPFQRVFCECVSEPGSGGDVIEIESRLGGQSDKLPFRVTCQFAMLRGPVRIQADFKGGSVIYSLLSFEPGLGDDGDIN